DEVADEYEPAPLGVAVEVLVAGIGRVAQLPKERKQFVVAAVNVADEVERPVLSSLVGPERLALDDGNPAFLGRRQGEDDAEPFAFEVWQRALEELRVPAHDVRAELPVCPLLVAGVAQFRR